VLSRPVRCLLSLLVLACSGRVFPWTAYHLERPARSARVILVRGLAGYWPGAEPLAHRLRKQGLDASVVFGSEGKGVACALAHEYRHDPDAVPIVLVGYSLGANEAIKIARRLDRQGIPVDSLVLIDCPYHDTIPPNVIRCLNIYRSRPLTDWIPMFRGLPVGAESPDTDLENFDTHREGWDPAPLTLNHFTICSSLAVHDEVTIEVLQALDAFEADWLAAEADGEQFEAWGGEPAAMLDELEPLPAPEAGPELRSEPSPAGDCASCRNRQDRDSYLPPEPTSGLPAAAQIVVEPLEID